jgi:hypothetical protein
MAPGDILGTNIFLIENDRNSIDLSTTQVSGRLLARAGDMDSILYKTPFS